MLLYFQHKKKGWVGSTGVEPYDGGMIYYMDKRNSYDIPASGLYEIDVDTANIYYPNDACYCFIRSGLKMVDSIEYIEAVKLGYQGTIPISEVRYATGQCVYFMSNQHGERPTPFILQKKNDEVVKVEISLDLLTCGNERNLDFDATDIFSHHANDTTDGPTLADIVPIITEYSHSFVIGLFVRGNAIMVEYGDLDYRYIHQIKYFIWKNKELNQVKCDNTVVYNEMCQTTNLKNAICDYMEEHFIAANIDSIHTITRKLCDENLLEITTLIPKLSCDLVCKMFNPCRYNEEIYEKYKDEVMSSCEEMLEKGRRLIKNGMVRDYAAYCSYRRFFAKKVK